MGSQHGGARTEWGVSDVQVRQANSLLRVSLRGEEWRPCSFRTLAVHFRCSGVFPATMAMQRFCLSKRAHPFGSDLTEPLVTQHLLVRL